MMNAIKWKEATFTGGMFVLFAGAAMKIAPDWDFGVSFIMAWLTYLTATNTVGTLKLAVLKGKISGLPRAMFDTWFAVDGAYTIYWFFMDRSALLMRDIQWPVSLCLYLMCGFAWSLFESESLADSPEPSK
jgi:hypothetical protein